MDNNKFECFAIVELFGHSRIAGKITEQSVGAATMFRVDVPETKAQPTFTRFLHPNAIYAINPVSEDMAQAMAEQINSKPIQIWDAEEVIRRFQESKKALNQPKAEDEEQEEDND